jgi:acyl dehydratase
MEYSNHAEPIYPKDFHEGLKLIFESFSLSEAEIIEFAKQFDPLDFHIDREAAKKSPFKGIIASGPHIFTLKHRTKWIPIFGHTVIAGIEVNNWKFLKPVYPDQIIHGSASIVSIKKNPEKQYSIVKWRYEFKDEKEEMVQSLEMVIMHKL